MFVTHISSDYTLNIPDDFRKVLPAGQEVSISVDTQGRLVITPIAQIHETLMQSFGMWADRTDLPDDSIDYVNEIRRGQRLNDAGWGMMKLVDTDIAIDHFHGHHAALTYFEEALASGDMLAISIVTLTELVGGMRDGEQAKTESLLKLFTLLDINEPIGRQAAAYLRQYRRTHRLELGDALIAGTAYYSDAELVTRNVKHYPMDNIRVIVPIVPYERGKG